MAARGNWLLMACMMMVLSGCGSTPEKHAALVKAQEDYQAARNDEQVIRYANDELRRAEQRLETAQRAWEGDGDGERVEHLSYLASRQIEIAQAVAERSAAEETVAGAEAQREKIRLESVQQRATQAEQRAQQLEQELKDLNAKQTSRGVEISLGDVLFTTGSASLKPGGVQNVEMLADYLEQHPERRVLIEGYTDSVGSESFNQQLSERRANAVRDVLVRGGIESSRIETIGYGEAFPVASNDNAGGRQLNRRVQVIISDESGKIPRR